MKINKMIYDILLGAKAGIIVSIIRAILVAITFGNLYSFIYSLTGTIFTFMAMLLLRQISIFGITGVSMIGGVFHNIGQLLCAILLIKLPFVLSYLAYMIIIGTFTGVLIGLISVAIFKRLNLKYIIS